MSESAPIENLYKGRTFLVTYHLASPGQMFMAQRWIVNLAPFIHFDNSRLKTYEHNISIASWNLKSVIDYLEIDPTHKFALDQVTLLEGFRKLFPNYWDALHQYVLEGRVEVVGGTYVMPDLVIPDGESIVRQFLFGTQFARSELGVEVRTGWAIDSSGHCAQMPQILRQCGIDSYYFWRGMPRGTPSEFVWKGPDGSRVNGIWLASGYDCAAWLSEDRREAFTSLLQIVERIGGRAASTNLFVPVGGELVPPPPHLTDIVHQWNEAFPDMKMAIVTPREFTEKLKSVQSKLSVIAGDMVSGRFAPTRHGGLASRITLKTMSRRLEGLLYLLELYLSLSGEHSRNVDVGNLWRILLFNHDHNIIRGILSDESYLFAKKRFEDAIAQAETMLESTLDAEARMVPSNEPESLVVFNPLSWTRTDVVRASIDLTRIASQCFEIKDEQGASVPYQLLGSVESMQQDIVFIARDVPSIGRRVYHVIPAHRCPEFSSSIRKGDAWVESDELVVEFDAFNGSMIRLFDKRNGFEVLRGSGNNIVSEQDLGDLYRYSAGEYLGKSSEATTLRVPAKVSVTESGPVRAVVEIRSNLQGSETVQRVIMYDGLHRLDLETEIEFKGRNRRLSLSYPLTQFSDRVAVGSQFGTEERLIVHQNVTDWSEDTTETFAALDWVDCAGPDAGLSYLTQGLHEFRFEDGRLRVTLLRSVDNLSRGLDDESIEVPKALERGHHVFRCCMVPHAKSWREAALWRHSAAHRLPLICIPVGQTEGQRNQGASALSISGIDLVLSCFKPTDNRGEYIVRLYEPAGVSGTARIIFGRRLKSVHLVDMCERDIGELSPSGTSVDVDIDPCTIVTLRVALEPE